MRTREEILETLTNYCLPEYRWGMAKSCESKRASWAGDAAVNAARNGNVEFARLMATRAAHCARIALRHRRRGL